ncbi:MAG: ArsA-related P-loop ATPase [Thermodesulfobacteriota bacterium]
MKLAVAGKGGAGKTSLAAWLADWLARAGKDVWLVDADTALSLGQASGLDRAALPVPLVRREDLVQERIGAGLIHLNPDVGDLPEALSAPVPLGGPASPGVAPGRKRLLVMGAVANAGGGCACAANALLKALLAHLVLDRSEWVVVDLEAGVEHLGRGTVMSVDALAVVSEPSRRALETGAEIGRLAAQMGLANQALVLNRAPGGIGPAPGGNERVTGGRDPAAGGVQLPDLPGLPPLAAAIPRLPGLEARQLASPSVLGLPESDLLDALCARLLQRLEQGRRRA